MTRPLIILAAVLFAAAVFAAETQPRVAVGVSALLEAAEAVRRAGRPDDALQIIDLAEPMLAADLTPAQRVSMRLQRARCAFSSARLAGAPADPAVQELRAILQAAEPLQDAPLIADVRDQLGLAIYSRDFRQNNLVEPRRLFELALEARRAFSDRRGMAESLFHVGLTWENKKDPSAEELRRARASHEEALNVAEAGGFDIEASYALRHLAGHKQDAGDLDGALAGFERSLALRTKAGYHIYLAPALLAVGDIWKAKGNAIKARAFYERALGEANRLKATSFQDSAREALRSLERDPEPPKR
jgi:tetratricopeptide (TPR) repeat protein